MKATADFDRVGELKASAYYEVHPLASRVKHGWRDLVGPDTSGLLKKITHKRRAPTSHTNRLNVAGQAQHSVPKVICKAVCSARSPQLAAAGGSGP